MPRQVTIAEALRAIKEDLREDRTVDVLHYKSHTIGVAFSDRMQYYYSVLDGRHVGWFKTEDEARDAAKKQADEDDDDLLDDEDREADEEEEATDDPLHDIA